MEKKSAKILLEKYTAGLCTDEERAIVERWYVTLPDRGETPDYEAILRVKGEIWNSLGIYPGNSYPFNWLKIISIAAVLIICLGTAVYFSADLKKKTTQTRIVKNDIAPGGNRATLILANGRKIILDTQHNGRIAQQQGVTITKTAGGQLAFTISGAVSPHPDTYNSIVTPRGGQYQISLPDGTRVWLNASSSLKFPATFSGIERRVELNGEAYFEVAKNQHMPFKVVTAQQEVEVMGTHFNINSYSNEPTTRTALFEGSVRVALNSSGFFEILKPGQQSVIHGEKLELSDADTEETLAWKNGLFIFNDEALESIMRKVSRWYNVEVVYQNEAVRREVFGGSVSRFGNVSEILRMLEITGNVHFEIEAHRIIATEK
ncbi:FecR family protein [Pedobacter sp. L105]|uniref:FecR family protein n=1 Tax=Pedobacter sp. L105 TaxID=1641871 RepID=UPI00131CD404|nr:FecR domain-containing protein [Pedobacter sp. L105]